MVEMVTWMGKEIGARTKLPFVRPSAANGAARFVLLVFNDTNMDEEPFVMGLTETLVRLRVFENVVRFEKLADPNWMLTVAFCALTPSGSVRLKVAPRLSLF